MAKTPSVEFEQRLEVFRTEVQSAIQYFYVYLAIHSTLPNTRVNEAINSAPLFWATVLGGLQKSTFMALGRIFDNDSRFNIGTLIRHAQDNRDIFSREGLKKRRMKKNPQSDIDWGEYVSGKYEVKAADLRKIRKRIAAHRKVYEEKYKDIRNKHFGHKEVAGAELKTLFSKTNIRELQQTLAFLSSVHLALRDLYLNGLKPTLNKQRISVQQIKKRKLESHQTKFIQESIFSETEEFLKKASKSWPMPKSQILPLQKRRARDKKATV